MLHLLHLDSAKAEELEELRDLARYFHQRKPRTDGTTDIAFATKAILPRGRFLAFLSCS